MESFLIDWFPLFFWESFETTQLSLLVGGTKIIVIHLAFDGKPMKTVMLKIFVKTSL